MYGGHEGLILGKKLRGRLWDVLGNESLLQSQMGKIGLGFKTHRVFVADRVGCLRSSRQTWRTACEYGISVKAIVLCPSARLRIGRLR